MRPRKTRNLSFAPEHKFFTPITDKHLVHEECYLKQDEIEAIKLKDLENKDQKSCALSMKISQPTFHRILKQARKKIALALIKGHSIRIN